MSLSVGYENRFAIEHLWACRRRGCGVEMASRHVTEVSWHSRIRFDAAMHLAEENL
jgi:hypothetical protein